MQSTRNIFRRSLKSKRFKAVNGIRYLPNIITFTRIALCIPLFFALPLSPAFIVIYIACGLSDILDGFIARKTGTASRFGSSLDGIADAVFIGVVLIKLIPLIEVPFWIAAWIIVIAAIKLTSLAVGYRKYHVVSFLSTYANKITGALLFCFPLLYAVIGTGIALACGACTIAGLSAAEELAVNIISKEAATNVKSIFTLRKSY